MRIFLLCLMSLLTSTSLAVTLAWDMATPQSGQTITATEILLDGELVGVTDQTTLTVDSSSWGPGDYMFTARHVGTVNGVPSVSAESEPLTYTIADSGAPGVAPLLRFRQLDRAS